MAKVVILFISMIGSMVWAHVEHDPFGTAIHKGSAKVLHEGDFVQFEFTFEASCYDDRNNARARVIGNVDTFVRWLVQESSSNGNNVIDYDIGLINVNRRDPYYGGAEYDCVNKYFAQQDVSVILNKSESADFLDSQIIQNFFNDLQMAISPLNFTELDAPDAIVSTKVSSVHKGVWEETSELLRITAKAKAQAKATRDFLAFLGDEYRGFWHLHSIDFSDRLFSDFIPISIVGGQAGGNIGGDVILSVLKLEPIIFEIHGNFLFHFELQQNYLP